MAVENWVSDTVVVVCAVVSVVSLGVAYWAYQHIRALPLAQPLKSDQEELSSVLSQGEIGYPHQEFQERLTRLERTIQSLDLSHVEALKILGGRLDQIETTLGRLAQVSATRFEKIEERVSFEGARDTQDAPSDASQKF